MPSTDMYCTPNCIAILSSFSPLAIERDLLQWQGQLVNDMRYLASVVTQCFTAFGELLALNKRFAELTGGVTRRAPLGEPPDAWMSRSLSLHSFL